MSPPPEHVAAPVPPASAPPYAFPLLATVAPVAVSLALWGITGSVFALVFAALGPTVALASLADARVQSRRRSRREAARFATDLEAARSETAAAHARESREIAAGSPTARRLVRGDWPESEQWLCAPGVEVPVCIGWGERPSSLVLDGAAVADRGRGPAHESLRALAREAARLDRAPVLVDARLGIAVLGRPPLATAVARGILLQVLASLSPASHDVTLDAVPGDEWGWLRCAPHEVRALPGGRAGPAGAVIARVGPTLGGAGAPRDRAATRQVPGGGEAAGDLVIAVAESRADLPRGARVVVEATATGARIAQHPERSMLADVLLDPVSREEAVAVASALARHASSAGLAGGAATVPSHVSFADCTGHSPPDGASSGAASSLECVAAITAHGPLRLDLVAQGPHAVVGGTTGSGKSELLIGWVLAMARAHSPIALSVLLVDFKGGSAFAPLTALPHCVGMITDLDEEGAARALESLAAELRRRERHLAASGAKSIDALSSGTALPRLVIVVDEFAAMVAGFPELHALFADIAARGRSLGVHLVLCSQRPAGVIRDAVLANSGLRVSLRVNNRADSMAVIGTDAAASLPLEPRGRGWVAADGAEAVSAQFPLVTPADVDAVCGRWARHPHRPHRPWLDPLPAAVPLDGLPEAATGAAAGVRFGLLDEPGEQAQPVAVYRPREHGNLLVVGGTGREVEGRQQRRLAGARAADRGAASWRARRVPSDIEGAWDVLQETLGGIRAEGGSQAARHGGRLLLVDDLDALLPRFPEEYGGEVLEVLGAIMREGPANGVHCRHGPATHGGPAPHRSAVRQPRAPRASQQAGVRPRGRRRRALLRAAAPGRRSLARLETAGCHGRPRAREAGGGVGRPAGHTGARPHAPARGRVENPRAIQ